jgi:hypothetical protein
MVNVRDVLIDGAVLSLLASLYLVAVLWFNPRLFLQDYPAPIQAAVPPKTEQEKRLSLIVGLPFLLLLLVVPLLSTLAFMRRSGGDVTFLAAFFHAFGVIFAFNVVDWLLLDWLVFCTLTPRFLVIPGSEGMAAYKDYFYHFRAFCVGTVLSLGEGLLIAAVVSWLA